MKSLEPDFTSVTMDKIKLPYDEATDFLRFSFTDPMLADYSLIVIADSKNGPAPENRLSTFIVRYPRYVHAEALRHRVISRNAASSRARSVKSTLKDVMETPVIPLFTLNQLGMGGKFPNEETRAALVKEWMLARDKDVTSVLSMLIGPHIRENKTDSEVAAGYSALLDDYYANGYDRDGEPKAGYLSAHKQQINRIIEAYTVFEEVITSTFWDNFISLRADPEAQPEIQALGVLVKHALKKSTPVARSIHAPFIAAADIPTENDSWSEIKPTLLRSSAESAKISYNDKSRATEATATAELGERLLAKRHLSPFEHPAIAKDFFEELAEDESNRLESDLTKLVSNFSSSWVQFRQVLAGITK